jgi:hypothetical protein
MNDVEDAGTCGFASELHACCCYDYYYLSYMLSIASYV